MIRNTKAWNEWESESLRRESLSVGQKLRILDGLYQEARRLGHFPPADPLEGLETDFLYAKAVNVRTDPDTARGASR